MGKASSNASATRNTGATGTKQTNARSSKAQTGQQVAAHQARQHDKQWLTLANPAMATRLEFGWKLSENSARHHSAPREPATREQENNG